MNARAYIIIYIVLTSLLTACRDGKPLKPHSGGEPYEVLITTDDDSLRRMADQLLSLPVEGLPQREEAFRLSHTTRLTGASEYARCIVALRLAATTDGRTAIRYEHNATAQPQLIVSITSPSRQQLHHDLPKVRRQLTALIAHFELTTEAERLKSHHSPKVSQALERQFGWSLLVPSDLTAMRQAQDFAWMQSQTPEGVRAICLYTYPATRLDTARLLDKRDSVMRANIPGEQPTMHMTTERRTSPRHRYVREQGRTIVETRGLWVMRGDAMGGPFVSRALLDSARQRVIVAEAFVYAPERKKAGLIRQLEASLHTLQAKGEVKE